MTPRSRSALLSDADVGLAPADSAAAAQQGAGPLSNTQDDGWLSGAAKGAGTAIIKGAAHIPGWVGDVNDLSRFLAAGAASMFDKRSASDIYASMKAKEDAFNAAHPLDPTAGVFPNAADEAAPVLRKTGDYQPTSEAGRLAQAGVEAAVGGLGPGAGGLTKGATLGSAILSTVKQAPLNAVAGAAGQGATDATGNPYLGLASSLIAPGLAETGGHVTAKVAAPFAEDLPVVGRAFTGTREARVGQQLQAAADDPAALRSSVGLGDGDAPAQSALPGSTPTLGQASGDLGILRAEEKARTADNVPFLDRETAQNSARLSALSAATPSDADAMAPSQYLAERAALIDQAGQAAQDRILGHAQDLAASLGPGQGAEVNGAAVRGALDGLDAGDAASDAANVGQARAAAAPLGPGNAPELNGATIRIAMETAKEKARQMRADLYAPETLDPNGDLALVTKPYTDAIKAVSDNIDPLGTDPSADVQSILAKAKDLPAVLPYRRVMALDTAITEAMAKERKANPGSLDLDRLGQLKTGIMSTINDALDNQHAYEQNSVATGRLDPSETTISRLKDTWDHPDDDTGRDAGDQGRATGASDAGGQAGGSAAQLGDNGAGGPTSGTPRQGSGDPGLQEEARPQPDLALRAADAASPFDQHVSPEVAQSLGRGIGRGATQEAVDGNTYLLNDVSRDASGQHSTRWVNVGPEANLSDTIEALRSIVGVKDDSPLGASSKAMADIYRRMGVGDTPTYTVAPEQYEKLTFTGRASDGVYSDAGRRIFLQDTGDAHAQLRTAVHEGAHAAFNDVAKNDPEVAANVAALQKHANLPAFREAWTKAMGGGPENDVSYGLQFKNEFLTEVFSNPKVQQYLSTIPAPPDLVRRLGLGQGAGTLRTAWDAFKATIAKAFGLPPSRESMSMLEATIGYGDRLSDAAMRRRGGGDGQSFSMRGAPGPDDPRFDAPAYDPDGGRGPAPQRPDVPRPQSLYDFVRQRGKMTDPGGDLAAMGLHKLIDRTGMDPDKMREAAAEAGYFGADTARAVRETTPADLFDRLEDGQRAYSERDHDAVLAWDQHDQARAAYDKAAGGDPALRSAGPRPKAPLSSYGADDIYAPGTQPEPPAPANGGLRPNADEGFAGRLADAKAAHAGYARTFKSGQVGADLRTDGYAGQYKTGAGAFAGKVLPAGPGGYDLMRARLRAIGNDPGALAALRDQAAAPLRAKLDDGMLPQSAIDAWRLKHDGALRALDEVSPGFSRSFDAAGAAHSAVLEARGAAGATNVTGRYAGTPAQTITRAIKSGPEGYERLKTLFDATKNDPAVIGAVRDQIVDPLRRGLLHDGTVAPKQHAAWADPVSGYGHALRALDEVSPGFSKGVADAAAASDILQRAGAVRQRQMEDFQGTAAARLLGKTSPDEVGATLLGILDDAKGGVSKARQVREALAASPDALAGAQKATMDAIARRYVSTAESGTSGEKAIASAGLQKFVANRGAALRELLPDHSVNTLQAIAADLERANRDITGTRIRGTSQTAKNQHGPLATTAAGHAGHTALGVAMTEGLMQAYEHGGLHGAALAAVPLLGGFALSKMRSSGASKEQAMFRDALLNPDRARQYLSKVPAGERVTPYHIAANMLRRELVTTPIVRQAYGR